MPHVSPRIALCGLAFTVFSCGHFFDSLDESEVPDYTRNWLHEQHGQVLTFRNAAGQVRTLTVSRKEEVISGSNKGGSYELERITLWYRNGPDSLLNLRLQARANKVRISRGNDDEFGFGSIDTYKSDGHTAFTWFADGRDVLRIVAQDTSLAGHPYRYLGFVHVPPVAHATDTVTAVYFSRYNGVVGFRTKRAGLWHRQ